MPQFQVFRPPNPKAVVLLYGWFGAQMKHVLKYSQLYHEKNCCITITGVCPPWETILKQDYKIEAFVKSSLAELDAVDDAERKLPLMVHCFSNGGGFCVQQLRRLLLEHEESYNKRRSISVETVSYTHLTLPTKA